VPRLSGLLIAAALLVAASGCGGDDSESLLNENDLRDCLTKAGLGGAPTDTGGYLLLLPAPDFVAHADDGTSLSVTVYGTEEKAKRAAADAEGATQSLGATVEVQTKRNAVLVFNPAPSDATRKTVDGCLD
jgi:hypothetical protein